MPAKKLGAMYQAQPENKKVEPLDQVLTVDTGDNTGWAYWTKRQIAPEVTGQITLPRRRGETITEQTQLQYMWTQFEHGIPLQIIGKPKIVLLESLEHWSQDEASLAAIRSGKLFKLAYLIGGYASISQRWGAELHFVKAREWKGQMTKIATELRVQKAINMKFKSSHITDAVGMGLSLMGIL